MTYVKSRAGFGLISCWSTTLRAPRLTSSTSNVAEWVQDTDTVYELTVVEVFG